MKILIVTATRAELRLLMERKRPEVVIPDHLYRFRMGPLMVHLLETGIGMVPMAFYLGEQLGRDAYDLALNAGICGTYDHAIPLGTVMHVTQERFPEAGVEEAGALRSLFELELIPADQPPYEGGILVNRLAPELPALTKLKQGSGHTVSTLLTTSGSIERLLSVFPADVESMEGAAFLFACLTKKLPCAELRAVSNVVGERDKAKWNIPLALKNLDKTLMKILEELMVNKA